MSWLEKILTPKSEKSTRHNIPEGVWTKCEACEQVLYRAELERNLNVCPKCGHHMKIGARERLLRFLDNGNQVELGRSNNFITGRSTSFDSATKSGVIRFSCASGEE